jgi:hypothetical protein
MELSDACKNIVKLLHRRLTTQLTDRHDLTYETKNSKANLQTQMAVRCSDLVSLLRVFQSPEIAETAASLQADPIHPRQLQFR